MLPAEGARFELVYLFEQRDSFWFCGQLTFIDHRSNRESWRKLVVSTRHSPRVDVIGQITIPV